MKNIKSLDLIRIVDFLRLWRGNVVLTASKHCCNNRGIKNPYLYNFKEKQKSSRKCYISNAKIFSCDEKTYYIQSWYLSKNKNDKC